MCDLHVHLVAEDIKVLPRPGKPLCSIVLNSPNATVVIRSIVPTDCSLGCAGYHYLPTMKQK
jgi:hypothetical protein